MVERPNSVTAVERKAAEERWPDIEDAFVQNLGITNDWDEAVDGCTVYEPDGWCPHGFRGLAQIRTGLA